MSRALAIERRQRDDRTSRRRHLLKNPVRVRGEDDRVVPHPRGGHAARRRADHDRCSAVERNALQHAVAVEAEPASVRREERRRAVLGAGDRLRLEIAHRAAEQLDDAVAAGAIHERLAVGRERGHGLKPGDRLVARGQRGGEPHDGTFGVAARRDDQRRCERAGGETSGDGARDPPRGWNGARRREGGCRRVVEIENRVADVAEAPIPVLLERASQQAPDRFRCRRRQKAEGRLPLQHTRENLVRRICRGTRACR